MCDLAAILVGGTFMGLTALGLIRARALASGDPRRALALMTAAFGLGQIIGPGFAGALSDRLGGFAAPSVVAATALLIAAALVSESRALRPACRTVGADPDCHDRLLFRQRHGELSLRHSPQ